MCYFPIIQSGGKYDIKISAQSNSDNLSPDIILCSLGSKYKGYCANMARTYMVNVPSKVETSYSILLSLYDACLEKMIAGSGIKDVYLNAKTFLMKKDPKMLAYLPKSLGFAMGLEFRDNLLVLNEKNENKFLSNQIFTLAVGFHNIPISSEEKKGSLHNLDAFSLLIADTVRIQNDAIPEILTKTSKDFSDVSYTISDEVSITPNVDIYIFTIFLILLYF